MFLAARCSTRSAGPSLFSFRRGGGLVDAPGRRLVGRKANTRVPSIRLILVLTLSASGASATTLGIQLDSNGDVLLLKGIGKGAKALSAYLADYAARNFFVPKPMTGGSVVESDGSLAAGLTE